jgi:nucleotide-binding universal stress UspA family protein
MKRFRKLLVVADDLGRESPAYQWALDLARQNGAEVTLVRALDVDVDSVTAWHRDLSGRELVDLLLEGCLTHLKGLVAPARGDGLRVSAKVLVGTPFVEIIREVLREGHDLVLRAPDPPKRFVGRLFTSLDMHLLRKCPCPVWIAAPNAGPRGAFGYESVLAAVDPSKDDSERNELNRVIMELATSLTRRGESELHVVHAWSLFGESTLRSGRYRISSEEVDRLVAEEREHRAAKLGALVREFADAGPFPTLHLVKGRPTEVVPAIAKRVRAGLVVMGTVARTGVSGLLMGNTAEEILGRVRCSVLAVKPRGFVTPVRLEPATVGLGRETGGVPVGMGF